LTMALSTRAARNRDALSDPSFDGEVALRSELEALRAKTRDQADLIARLQSMVEATGGRVRGRNGVPAPRAADGGLEGATGSVSQAALEAQIQALRATAEERASTIKRLEASLAAYQADGAENRSESKIAMKARLRALQSQVDSQSELIERLRAELAASNERLALQSAQFRDEIRRLGAGTLPASGQARRPDAARAKRSLAERIGQTMPPLATSVPPTPVTGAPAPTQASPPAVSPVPAAAPADGGVQSDHASPQPPVGSGGRDAAANGASVAAEAKPLASQKRAEPQPKQRLLDRIASLDKS
jgi:hypothetical protein